jgi:tetratricopeptide (TPR) repeat protein
LLAVALVSAAPAERAEQRLRQGNAAFQQGDYEQSLRDYEQAETETTDPGLVAFNEAAALYRLGRYAEAAEHYLRSREDAAGFRRARLLYDMGNCLVQQAQERDAPLLERAVRSYQECVRDPASSDELRTHAEENLKIARVLLVRAKAAKSQSESPDQPEKPSAPEQPEARPPSGDPRSAGLDPAGEASPVPETKPGGDEGMQTNESAPGTGNLPPIPDDEKMLPMSHEETAAYLREATARILRARQLARQQHRHVAPNRSAGVKDW